jgi:hypothetical protein
MRTIASGADGRVNQELADRLSIEDARRGRCGRCERKKRPSFCPQRNTMLGTSDVPRRRCALGLGRRLKGRARDGPHL